MSGAIGRSLELYYIDGRPDGMLTAELFNWTGHVLMTPRTQIAKALARPESSYAGIYLLLGENDGEPLAYIGEGEDISARIRSHDVKKDWWTSAILITAAANKLNKAHVRYLEARLIAEANSIGRVPLENGTAPSPPSLSEADVAKMEAFLENLLVVLPAVRVDMFIQRARPALKAEPPVDRKAVTTPAGETIAGEERFQLRLKREGFAADAVQNANDEFVVLEGSQARPLTNAGSYSDLYHELRRSGVITEAPDGSLRFSKSYAFRSPSAASSVAMGRSSNGLKEWKHAATGLSYREWEASKLSVDPEALLRELGI